MNFTCFCLKQPSGLVQKDDLTFPLKVNDSAQLKEKGDSLEFLRVSLRSSSSGYSKTALIFEKRIKQSFLLEHVVLCGPNSSTREARIIARRQKEAS